MKKPWYTQNSSVNIILGNEIWRVLEIAHTVMDLLDTTLKPSARRTYKTGQWAYSRFLETLQDGIHFPFKPLELRHTELNLAFNIAFLLLEPTDRKASTILGYETHVKSWFRSEGCPE